MRAMKLRGILLAGVALAAAGCMSTSRGRALEMRVDKLTSDNEQLAAQLKNVQEKLAATVPKIDAKIAEVAKALDSLDRASRRSGADATVQLQKTIEDVAQLRGQIEEYAHQIDELQTALKKYTDETDLRFAEIQGPEAAKAALARRKFEELNKPADKKAFLKLADDRLNAGELVLARQLYADFLKRFGKDDLAGEAHYGVGESFYREDKCREALAEFGIVVKEYARSKSAPNAYLHSAECFKKLKMSRESRLALEELVQNYPRTPAAKEAKLKLAELSRGKKGNNSKGKGR
jgi:TolA-binding protein